MTIHFWHKLTLIDKTERRNNPNFADKKNKNINRVPKLKKKAYEKVFTEFLYVGSRPPCRCANSMGRV